MDQHSQEKHSPRISGMLEEIPRPVVRLGIAVTLVLLAAIAAALLLVPSPYDPSQSLGRHIFAALFS